MQQGQVLPAPQGQAVPTQQALPVQQRQAPLPQQVPPPGQAVPTQQALPAQQRQAPLPQQVPPPVQPETRPELAPDFAAAVPVNQAPETINAAQPTAEVTTEPAAARPKARGRKKQKEETAASVQIQAAQPAALSAPTPSSPRAEQFAQVPATPPMANSVSLPDQPAAPPADGLASAVNQHVLPESKSSTLDAISETLSAAAEASTESLNEARSILKKQLPAYMNDMFDEPAEPAAQDVTHLLKADAPAESIDLSQMNAQAQVRTSAQVDGQQLPEQNVVANIERASEQEAGQSFDQLAKEISESRDQTRPAQEAESPRMIPKKPASYFAPTSASGSQNDGVKKSDASDLIDAVDTNDLMEPLPISLPPAKSADQGEPRNTGASLQNRTVGDKSDFNESISRRPQCQDCGAMLEAGSRFCGECGGQLLQRIPQCHNCGIPLEPSAKFCGECGARC